MINKAVILNPTLSTTQKDKKIQKSLNAQEEFKTKKNKNTTGPSEE